MILNRFYMFDRKYTNPMLNMINVNSLLVLIYLLYKAGPWFTNALREILSYEEILNNWFYLILKEFWACMQRSLLLGKNSNVMSVRGGRLYFLKHRFL